MIFPLKLTISGFHFPLLTCDIDDIDVDLISWRNPNTNEHTNPHLSFDDYNLIFDVPYEGMKRSKNMESRSDMSTEQEKIRPIFNVVKQWPPEWAQKKRLECRDDISNTA